MGLETSTSTIAVFCQIDEAVSQATAGRRFTSGNRSRSWPKVRC